MPRLYRWGIVNELPWASYGKIEFNPRLTKLFFVTRLTGGGGCYNPSLYFPNRTPYEIDFGINR